MTENHSTNLGPLFDPPGGPDHFWIVIVLIAVPTIAMSVYVLVRGQLPSPLSASTMLLFPVFAYVLGGVHLADESKSVAFCGSCHVTMPPLVESMQMEGRELASAHFRMGAVSHKEACYVCHSGYGLSGDVGAKIDGLSHMIHTVLGTENYPIRMRSTFDIDSCLDCHATSEPFRAVKGHRTPGIQEELLSGEIGCTGACHEPAHPAAALNGTASWERWKERMR